MKDSIMLVCILMILSCSVFAEDKPVATPAYGVYVEQGEKGVFLLVTDMKPCTLAGSNFICAKEVDGSWVDGKTVYINPDKIESAYEFTSVEDYNIARQKGNTGESNNPGIFGKMLGK